MEQLLLKPCGVERVLGLGEAVFHPAQLRRAVSDQTKKSVTSGPEDGSSFTMPARVLGPLPLKNQGPL